jgi:AcrR family transcriptional regulator
MRDALDACLTKAFRDVAVPEGLAERLLAGLAVERPRPRSRRWLLLAGGLAATAAAIVLAVWLGGGRADSISGEVARNEAIRLFEAGLGQPGSALAASAPAAYPLSSYVQLPPGTTWRRLSDFLRCSCVVYDLPGRPGARAALYVIACDNAVGLGQSPASAKDAFLSASSRCCASVWQENGLLYVLVVEGDQSNYERYLNLPSSPVV